MNKYEAVIYTMVTLGIILEIYLALTLDPIVLGLGLHFVLCVVPSFLFTFVGIIILSFVINYFEQRCST